MEQDIRNRMTKDRRRRKHAENSAVEHPDRAPQPSPGRPRTIDKEVRCGYCGRVFVPRIIRTVGDLKHFHCPCCTIKFKKTLTELEKLQPGANLRW